MSEPVTEPIDTANLNEPEPKPARELSQAAIASFFYGTLQLLTTSIGAGLVFVLAQMMKAFQSAAPTGVTGIPGTTGTDTVDLAEVEKMMKELGITDPSAVPVAPTTPDMPAAVPDSSTIPGMPSGFSPEGAPFQITGVEILLVLLMNGFGLLGLITAFIAFEAVSKGKSGRGLAITGLVSSTLSFVIAFMVAAVV
jgi:hypothetical protein